MPTITCRRGSSIPMAVTATAPPSALRPMGRLSGKRSRQRGAWDRTGKTASRGGCTGYPSSSRSSTSPFCCTSSPAFDGSDEVARLDELAAATRRPASKAHISRRPDSRLTGDLRSAVAGHPSGWRSGGLPVKHRRAGRGPVRRCARTAGQAAGQPREPARPAQTRRPDTAMRRRPRRRTANTLTQASTPLF